MSFRPPLPRRVPQFPSLRIQRKDLRKWRSLCKRLNGTRRTGGGAKQLTSRARRPRTNSPPLQCPRKPCISGAGGGTPQQLEQAEQVNWKNRLEAIQNNQHGSLTASAPMQPVTILSEMRLKRALSPHSGRSPEMKAPLRPALARTPSNCFKRPGTVAFSPSKKTTKRIKPKHAKVYRGLVGLLGCGIAAEGGRGPGASPLRIGIRNHVLV